MSKKNKPIEKPIEKPKPFIVEDGIEVQKILKSTGIMPNKKFKVDKVWHYEYTEKPKGIK